MTDRELDALLAEIRANRPKPPPDPAPPPPEPELHARLDTARTFLGAMFLTLTLLGAFSASSWWTRATGRWAF